MDLQLKGKRALVTGSSSGIGAAIAKTLAQEGASVVIQGRKQVEAERVAQEIIANGASSVVAIGDLTKNEDAAHVVETALSALGSIDILVNNVVLTRYTVGWKQPRKNGYKILTPTYSRWYE